MSLKIFGQGEPIARLSSGQVKYAIGMATAAITSLILSPALHLSGGYWSVLSAVIVFGFDFENVSAASSDRLFETVAGRLLPNRNEKAASMHNLWESLGRFRVNEYSLNAMSIKLPHKRLIWRKK